MVSAMCRVAQVIAFDPAQFAQSEALAAQFSVPHVDGTALIGGKRKEWERFIRSQFSQLPGFVFLFTATGLQLAQISEQSILCIQADFCGATVRYRREKGGGRGQMIAKAVGLRGDVCPTVLDATAGLGGDAFVLASLGAKVKMVERVPEVRALLASALITAEHWAVANEPGLTEVLKRMELVAEEATPYMASLEAAEQPDVIYLDPMFPSRSKSALVKKEMRVFHDLVGSDEDADALLDIALQKAKQRVVVKRPRLASNLNDCPPSHVLNGQRNRYDVYVQNSV